MKNLDRLMRPKSIAVIGGGTWCSNVIRECKKIGFCGEIWPVHPTRSEVAGVRAYASIDHLPEVPDASFIGVNRDATVSVVKALSAMGAGGAVCFASGFSEASAELSDGAGLQEELVSAAGDMPIFGPNCYGFVNALDQVALWPDVHGLVPCKTGVAIVGQSSNVAINLSMQRRGLPVAYVVTAGNQAQTGMAHTGAALLRDPRVTALGLHIEGVTDLAAYESLARTATELGKPVVVLKVGRSDQARQATVSHTASLAGSDAGARALMQRLGFAQVDSPSELLETLKIFHVSGGLVSNKIASMSCSGGEASLMADLGQAMGVEYPSLNGAQSKALRAALGPKVALANPLDYHTYIWGDRDALTNCFTAMMEANLALGCVVLDFPREDRFAAPEWKLVLDAVAETARISGKPMALLASMGEGMPETIAEEAISRGVIPLVGMSDGLAAIAAASQVGPTADLPLIPPICIGTAQTYSEAQAKVALAAHGLSVPVSKTVTGVSAAKSASEEIGYPVVLKGIGFAHKTELGAVKVNLTSAALVEAAAMAMPCEEFLVEEMVTDTVAELLVGVLCDPAHGFVMTIGAGGILTEILSDTVSFLLPVSSQDIKKALTRLSCYPLLTGCRGKPPANLDAIVSAILSLQTFVHAHRDRLLEVEINPLLCSATNAIAVDALIRMGEVK